MKGFDELVAQIAEMEGTNEESSSHFDDTLPIEEWFDNRTFLLNSVQNKGIISISFIWEI